jgi:DNA-binding beta-propeller fold protein YncE
VGSDYTVNPFALAVNQKTDTVYVMVQLSRFIGPSSQIPAWHGECLVYLLILDTNTNKAKAILIDRPPSFNLYDLGYEGDIAVNPATNKIYVTSVTLSPSIAAMRLSACKWISLDFLYTMNLSVSPSFWLLAYVRL